MSSKETSLSKLVRDFKELLKIFYELNETLGLDRDSFRNPEEIRNEEILKCLQETINSYRDQRFSHRKFKDILSGEDLSAFLKKLGGHRHFLIPINFGINK
jgi:hypothetical protein